MWHRKACEFDQSESSAKSQEAKTPMVPGTMTFSLFSGDWNDFNEREYGWKGFQAKWFTERISLNKHLKYKTIS